MTHQLTNEEIARIFALYFPNTECITPDGRGIIVGLPHHIKKNETVYVHFGTLVKTKSSIDGGYNKIRNHGCYNIKAARYEPIGAIGKTDDGFDVPGGVKMLLTPLSKITDEDAIEVASTCLTGHWQIESKDELSVVLVYDKYLVEIWLNEINFIDFRVRNLKNKYQLTDPELSLIDIIDLLRSKGYALPYKGISLFKLGIAIDKTTL